MGKNQTNIEGGVNGEGWASFLSSQKVWGEHLKSWRFLLSNYTVEGGGLEGELV